MKRKRLRRTVFSNLTITNDPFSVLVVASEAMSVFESTEPELERHITVLIGRYLPDPGSGGI